MFHRHTIEKTDIVRVSVITPKIHNQYNITDASQGAGHANHTHGNGAEFA
jgi:hypothetical protein